MGLLLLAGGFQLGGGDAGGECHARDGAGGAGEVAGALGAAPGSLADACFLGGLAEGQAELDAPLVDEL